MEGSGGKNHNHAVILQRISKVMLTGEEGNEMGNKEKDYNDIWVLLLLSSRINIK